MSRGLAQFDFGTASPSVPRPSFTVGSNATPVRTAALYAFTVRRNPAGSTSSSLPASASRVSAATLVTSRMRYSSRSRWATFASNTCHASCPGCSSTVRPYFA